MLGFVSMTNQLNLLLPAYLLCLSGELSVHLICTQLVHLIHKSPARLTTNYELLSHQDLLLSHTVPHLLLLVFFATLYATTLDAES